MLPPFPTSFPLPHSPLAQPPALPARPHARALPRQAGVLVGHLEAQLTNLDWALAKLRVMAAGEASHELKFGGARGRGSKWAAADPPAPCCTGYLVA